MQAQEQPQRRRTRRVAQVALTERRRVQPLQRPDPRQVAPPVRAAQRTRTGDATPQAARAAAASGAAGCATSGTGAASERRGRYLRHVAGADGRVGQPAASGGQPQAREASRGAGGAATLWREPQVACGRVNRRRGGRWCCGAQRGGTWQPALQRVTGAAAGATARLPGLGCARRGRRQAQTTAHHFHRGLFIAACGSGGRVRLFGGSVSGGRRRPWKANG